MSEDLRITMEDCRRAGHCVRGIKRWFEGYGFDFRAFLSEGIDRSTFLNTGDAHAIHIVKLKDEAENG